MRRIKRNTGKKGISPVIATVLLITLAVVLAAIIFLWARQFISEKLTKGGEVIENKCGEVTFRAEITAQSSAITVVNDGNVPLYGVDIKLIGAGETVPLGNPFSEVTQETTISAGQTQTANLNGGISPGDKFRVTPVLLGLNDNGERKSYVCADSFAQDVIAG